MHQRVSEACMPLLELALPPSLLLSLPHSVLNNIAAALPCSARCSARLACRLLACALAESFDAVCVDATAFSADPARAARSLRAACPLARRAVVRVHGDAPPPPRGALEALFLALAAGHRHLEALTLEDTWSCPPPFCGAAGRCPPEWRAEALSLAAEALVAAGFGPAIKRIEVPPAALILPNDGRGAPADAPRRVAPLSALRGLREVSLREPEPDKGEGVPCPEGLREVAMISGLATLAVEVDSRDSVQAWSALMHLPASPAGPSLVTLRLGCAGPGAVDLPASWLLRLPRLRRLDLSRGISLDFSDFPAGSSRCERWSGASRAGAWGRGPGLVPSDASSSGGGKEEGTPLRLPPLEHLSLSQARLDDSGWHALADAALLGARLTSLELWRCGAPPAGLLLRAPRPFPALVRMHLGTTGEPSEVVAAAAAVKGLTSLSLHHVSGGGGGARGFSSHHPCRLAALTGLTRLVLMPVSTGCAIRWSAPLRRGGGGGGGEGGAGRRVPLTAEEAALLASLRRLQFYDGPIPGCDSLQNEAWY